MRLNTQQIAALRHYAKVQGKTWKQDLAIDWMRGTDESLLNGHLLRQIRNNFGPKWLATFDLTTT